MRLSIRLSPTLIISLSFHALLVIPTDGNSSHTGSVAVPAPAASRPLEEGPDSENLIWRVLLGKQIGPDELLTNISTNQLLREGEGVFSLEVDYSSVEQGGQFPLNSSLGEFSLGALRNDTGDLLFPNRTLLTGMRSNNRTNRTR